MSHLDVLTIDNLAGELWPGLNPLTSVFSFVKWDGGYIIVLVLSEVMSGK